MNTSPFLIRVYDASGNPLGPGSINTVMRLDNTEELDAVGTCIFTMPASDPMYQYISEGTQFDIYDAVDGYIGLFLFKSDSLAENSEKGTVAINCYSVLRELINIPLGFRRYYLFTAVEDVVSDIMGLAAGWTSTIETGIGNTTVNFEAESILSALNGLGGRWDTHIRLNGFRNLEFGFFGEDSGIYAMGIEATEQGTLNAKSYVSVIKTITRKRDADWIINKVVPVGGGQGINQLTIEGATSGIYTIQLLPNFDGTNTAYIEDTASQALYGVKLHQASFPQITPLSNNDTDILRARNALKLTAETYLTKHKAPNDTYELSVNALRQKLLVGDKINVRYQGTDRITFAYLDINDSFYVNKIERRRNSNGDRSANLKVTTVQDHIRNDTDIIVDVISDVKALKVYMQPSAYTSTYVYTDTISSYAGGLAAYIGDFPGKKPAVFQVLLDNKLTYLTQITLRFRTWPVEITGDFYSTPTANTGYWNETLSLYFPKNIHLYINGENVSEQLGGPWNLVMSDTQVDETIDITEIIKNAVGGIYQQHSIVFVCYTKNTTDELRINTSHPSSLGDSSMGKVELTVNIQGGSTGLIQI